MSERIIVDGRALYRGHPLAWRRGVIVGDVTAVGGGGVPGSDTPVTAVVSVRLERRGRERKVREARLPLGALCERTEGLERSLRAIAARGEIVFGGHDDAAE